MCDNQKQNDCGCLNDILKTIMLLQNQDFECDSFSGCDKPYLGPTPNVVCYNTRPISFYNCSTGALWEFTYTAEDGTTGTSTVFRVENLDDCCCTCRILYPNTDTTNDSTYNATNDFFTINLNCVGAIRCLNDTYVDLC